jgi:hypothetical protein
LCSTAIWLEGGSIRASGASQAIVTEYLSQGALSTQRIVKLDRVARQFVERDDVRVTSIQWLSDLPLRHGEEVRARIFCETRASVANVAVGIGFCDLAGRRILTYDTDLQDGRRPNLRGPAVYSIDLRIDALPLTPDTYAIDIGCRSGDFYALDYIPEALRVEVLPGPNTPGFISQRLSGVRLKSDWTWNFENSLFPLSPVLT